MNQHNHADLKASTSTKLMNDVIRTCHFLLYSHSDDLCATYRLSANKKKWQSSSEEIVKIPGLTSG